MQVRLIEDSEKEFNPQLIVFYSESEEDSSFINQVALLYKEYRNGKHKSKHKPEHDQREGSDTSESGASSIQE